MCITRACFVGAQMLPVCTQSCYRVQPQRLAASKSLGAPQPQSHCCCPALRHTDALSLEKHRGLPADACTNWALRSAAVVSAAAAVAAVTLGVQPSHAGGAVLAAAAAAAAASSAASTDTAAIVPVDPSTYVPGPIEVGWQIWFAAIISTVPFVIGAYEFGKRILIQRRCEVCGGSGLVQKGKYPKKCPQCGGFFPWISWEMFLSANARPGNGGPLLQPRGQTSVFYSVPPNNGGTADKLHHSNSSSSSSGPDKVASQPTPDQQHQKEGSSGSDSDNTA